MDTHFISTSEFIELPLAGKRSIIDSLRVAEEDGDFVSIRVQDNDPSWVDICTMGADAAHEYNATGGGWTYVHPRKLLDDIQKLASA